VRRSLTNGAGVVLLVGLIGLVILVWRARDDEGAQSVVVPPLGAVSDRSEPLYPKDDPWAAYLAPDSICPGGSRSFLSARSTVIPTSRCGFRTSAIADDDLMQHRSG
jgi:hypothetical protein